LTKVFETNVRVMKTELVRLQHEQKSTVEKIKENAEKLKVNKQLPYLVANCVEVRLRVGVLVFVCVFVVERFDSFV
jgi:ATP-dependent 26S proteasome regulatory subunit